MEKITLFFALARFVLREMIGEAVGGLLDGLRGHFADHSLALLKALDEAAEQTGKVCELVFDARPTDKLLASGEIKALALPLRQLLDERGDAFQRQCRDEWRRARAGGFRGRLAGLPRRRPRLLGRPPWRPLRSWVSRRRTIGDLTI